MVLKSVIAVTHSRFLKSFISTHHNEAYSSSAVPAADELSLGKNATFACCSNWDILIRMGNAHSTANGRILTSQAVPLSSTNSAQATTANSTSPHFKTQHSSLETTEI
jgi:hypothetical protein